VIVRGIHVICGPTGGGKSALAMRLAEQYRIAIISADSRQVYRGFDIGTAKPDTSERQRVIHYGLDLIEPTERYSAARWAEDAREWITLAIKRERTPVVVGGTGLYIRALFEPLSPVPELDPAKRAELDVFLTSRTVEDLRQWCRLLDPSRAHLGRTQLIRAIETALLSGSKLSESYERDRRARAAKPEMDELLPSYLLVDPGAPLQEKLENRFDEMIALGWLDEVRRLADAYPESAPAWKASGYSALRAVARGETDLATARARVIIETRQYAKRQRTWFRNQLPAESVTRFDPESPGGDLIAQQWWDDLKGTE
jgi:tRNA dimethylallyltransferase